MAAIALRVTLFVFAIAALGCGGGAGLFTEAQRAMEDDDVEKAARLYQEVTLQAPGSPLAAEAHYELAQIYYLRLKNVEAARDSLLAVLQDYPNSAVEQPARLLMARLYDEVFNDPSKAVVHYRAVLDEELGEGLRRETLLAMGHCHYELQAIDAAKDAYRRALSLSYHADTDGTYLRLANIERLTGDAEESLRLLRDLQRKTADMERRKEAMLSEVEILVSFGRFQDAHERLADVEQAFPLSVEVDELTSRLLATETLLASLDGDGEQALLQEQQKKIRWGGGRRRRKPAPNKP